MEDFSINQLIGSVVRT